MAVPAGPTEVRYVGNGVTTIFTIPFLLIVSTDLAVYVDGTPIGSGYVITGAGNPTSTITFYVAPGVGADIYLALNVPFERLNDYQENGDFLASTVNRDFDRIWQALKQLYRGATRALTLGAYDIDGQGWYRAKGNGIRDLRDPIQPQDAATFKSVGDLISQIQGPINNSANVLYIWPDGTPRVVQNLSSSIGATGIGYGSSSVGETLDSILTRSAAEQDDAVLAFAQDYIGDLGAYGAAVQSGTVRIAIASDSIFEGLSQITYDDSPIGIVMRLLREQNPRVNFVFGNFCLAGRNVSEFNNPAYVGIVPPDNPLVGFFHPASSISYSLWPGGSIVGKSWLNHVKDFTPDLVILGFGMNNVAGDANAYIAITKNVIGEMNLWPKKPSIVLANPMQRTLSLDQTPIQSTADAIRSLAQEGNYTMVDANRRYLLLRDAVDIVNKKSRKDDGFAGFPSGWTVLGSATPAGDALIIGAGSQVIRNLPSEDTHVTATFNSADWSTATPVIYYRRQVAAPFNSYSVLITGTTLILQYTAPFASAPIPALVNNQPVVLEIEVRGAHHKVFVNGSLYIDVYDYKEMRPGEHSLQVSGAGSAIVSAYSAQVANRFAFGRPKFTEAELLGVDDWLTNPNSIGGNAINHPSKLGATMVYGVAFLPLLRATKQLSSGPGISVKARFTDTVTPFDNTPGQAVNIVIDGISGPETMVTVPVGGTGSATAQFTDFIQGGRVINFSIFLSATGTSMASIFSLPPGVWLVRAVLTLSRNSSGYRNNLDIVATRSS